MTAVAEAPAKKATAAPKKEYFDLSTIGATVEPPRAANDSFSMLLYGAPKVGKTLLAATMQDVPELSPVLLLACEDGSAVLGDKYPDIDVINVPNWTVGAAVIEAVAEGKTKYKSMIVDTVPELQSINKSHITKDARQLSLPEWGTLAENTVNTVKMLHRSTVNVVFIAHSDRVKDNDTGKIVTAPVFLGNKSGPEILKTVDIIAYMAIAKDEQGDSVRVLQTVGDGKIDAGDRFGKLDAQIPNPSFEEIFKQLTQ